MFLDRISKKTLSIVGILCTVLATIMLILVIVIPILLKRKLTNDYIEKCNPTLENTKIWASFPGELDSKLLHTFKFFDYQETNEKDKPLKINYKSNVVIEEQVNYTNFSKDENNIYFTNSRNYKNVADKTQNEDVSIKSINLGMFEALETMSYPPLYKIGIESIYYLKEKVLIDAELFIRELFTVYTFVFIEDIDIKNYILKDVSPRKVELIMDKTNPKYKKYSLNTPHGFFEWAKLLGSKEKISNATWLKDLFDLTDTEINSVLLNDDSDMIQDFAQFNAYIAKEFKCKNETKCGDELLYKQLIENSVISGLPSAFKNFKELNTYLKTNYYPFDTEPEMRAFFDNEYKYKKQHIKNYKDVELKREQLEKFLNVENKYCLLSLENSMNILYLNKTEDNKKDTKYYDDLTYDKVNFLTEYFYDYLPRIFLYPPQNNALTPDPKYLGLTSKAVSNLLPKISEYTFDKIANIDIISYFEEKISFVQMKKVLSNYELEEICPVIMQKVLNDAKKVFKVCSDENVNFSSEKSLNSFIKLYYCQEETKDEKKCDKSIANYLKTIIYISDSEIANLVSKNSIIGQIISSSHDILISKYNCQGKCTNEYLLKLQFAKAKLTQEPPEPLEKAEGLRAWFPELQDDYEIINIKKKHGNQDPFKEQDAFWIVDTKVNSGDIYDLNNFEAFMNKMKFEKEYSKDLNENADSSSLVKLMNFLLGIYVFDDKVNKNNSLIINYSSIDNFLKGKSEENQYWIDYLKSGNYYENFKPKISGVTPFDFGFNFDKKEEENLNFDYIGINSKTNDHNKRRIDKMNNLLTLNIKKSDYDITKDSYTSSNFSLYNYERLIDDRKFADGFQYDNSLEYIYYYDLISSRPLRFKKKDDFKYKGKVECKKYHIDTEDFSVNINENFDKSNKNAMLIQKVNKPFMLSFDNAEILKKFGLELEQENKIEENYICVDPITDMVIDSKLNFMYALNTRKYGYLNKNIGKNTLYPLFYYQRNYEVNVDSYERQFPGVTEYYENSTVFIIVGAVLIVIFVAIAVVAFIYLNKKVKSEGTLDIKESLNAIATELNNKSDEDRIDEIINENN